MATRFLIIIALLVLAEIYSFIVVRSAVRMLPGGWRTSLIVLYIVLSLLVWSSIFLFRVINWASLPHMIRNIFVAFSIGLVVGKLLVLVVMLGDELRRLIVWIAQKFQSAPEAVAATGKGISRSIFLKRMALIVGGTTLGAFLYGITNRYDYRIRRIKLRSAALPAAFRGLKIVQISDIHSGSFDNHHAVERGVKMVMDEKADIIFFTGDLVNNKSDEVVPYMDLFATIKAPMGVYSTLGNHDYGDYVQWPSAEAKRANLERLKAIHGGNGLEADDE